MSPPTVTPAPTRRAPPTVATPVNATLPVVTNTVATPEPTFNFVPSNDRFASSSSSPEDPAITTLLSVKSLICAEFATKPPAIFAPSSTSNTSMFAVPSTSILPLKSISPLTVRFARIVAADESGRLTEFD